MLSLRSAFSLGSGAQRPSANSVHLRFKQRNDLVVLRERLHARGQLGLAHSAWQSGFGYTRLNVGLRRRHFGTTVLSVGRNDCAKGRFGLRGLSDQHVARRRLKVGVVTAAVNMTTFGSARMSRQRRVLSNHQLRTSQAKRRVADVVVVMLSHHKTTLSLNARK